MTESKTPPLKTSKEEPDSIEGYSAIGLFSSRKEAMDWYNKAIKAGKTYPFWLQTGKETQIGKMWILWWKKPKNAKKKGKGFA